MSSARKLSFAGPCIENRKPRIGGGALIQDFVEWPIAPDGEPLTLVLSMPASFLNENAGLNIPAGLHVSVFSYYSKSKYFLDCITYHGSSEELEWIRKGCTRVIIHRPESEVFGHHVIPAIAVDTGSEAENAYGGSKIGGDSTLLQNEALALGKEKFALQLYGGDFPSPYRGVLGLTDAVGYLYIDPMRWRSTPADAGTFFVQVT